MKISESITFGSFGHADSKYIISFFLWCWEGLQKIHLSFEKKRNFSQFFNKDPKNLLISGALLADSKYVIGFVPWYQKDP